MQWREIELRDIPRCMRSKKLLFPGEYRTDTWMFGLNIWEISNHWEELWIISKSSIMFPQSMRSELELEIQKVKIKNGTKKKHFIMLSSRAPSRNFCHVIANLEDLTYRRKIVLVDLRDNVLFNVKHEICLQKYFS